MEHIEYKEVLNRSLQFGERMIGNSNIYKAPDLTHLSPKELWNLWSNDPILMGKMRTDRSIRVSYGGGPFAPFVPGQNNYHQALALACFLYYTHLKDAWVSGPHVHGGEFRARFHKSNNMVTYTTDDGRTVTFGFDKA